MPRLLSVIGKRDNSLKLGLRACIDSDNALYAYNVAKMLLFYNNQTLNPSIIPSGPFTPMDVEQPQVMPPAASYSNGVHAVGEDPGVTPNHPNIVGAKGAGDPAPVADDKSPASDKSKAPVSADAKVVKKPSLLKSSTATKPTAGPSSSGTPLIKKVC